ncbi:MAG TPA: hypothetical protein EYP74_01075 [Anaerolineales bacterium]|nr:hypothetical protein [Anaerolineales bacterium]
MPRIRCLYLNCLYLDADICTAPFVEIDPDIGCTNYIQGNGLIDENDEYEDWGMEELDIDLDDEDEINWD